MNSLLRRFWIGAVVIAAVASTAENARAGLMGATVDWQYYAYGGEYTYPGGITGGSFIVNGGVGGSFIGGTQVTYFNIVADDTSITFDYTAGNQTRSWSDSPLSLAPTIYNGIALTLPSGPTITSVSIDASTNMVGFDASHYSFTGNQIQVDWHLLDYSTSTIVKLNVGTSAVVPEPSTLALAGGTLLLGGIACVRRNRRRAAA